MEINNVLLERELTFRTGHYFDRTAPVLAVPGITTGTTVPGLLARTRIFCSWNSTFVRKNEMRSYVQAELPVVSKPKRRS